MFEYLSRLSVEADVNSRQAKREGQSKAYWLGHSMTRFNEDTAICRTCSLTMRLTVDGVRGDAVEQPCQQQMLFKGDTHEAATKDCDVTPGHNG